MPKINKVISTKYLRLSDKGDSIEKIYGSDMINKFIVRNEDNNTFMAFDKVKDFALYMKSVPSEKRTFHEIIFGENRQRLKFDIDMKLSEFSNIDISSYGEKENIITFIITTILDTFKFIFRKKLQELNYKLKSVNNIILTTSHSSEKLSYHVIIRGFSVESNEHAAAFAEHVKNALPISLVKFIDNVYKSTQSFRLLGCTKKNTYRPKLLDTNHYLASLEESIIQFHDEDISLEIYVTEKYIPVDYGTLTKEVLDKILKSCEELIPEFHCFKFRDIRENIINFTRVNRGHCSICEAIHTNENSMYVVYAKGEAVYRCRRDTENRYISICNINSKTLNKWDYLKMLIPRTKAMIENNAIFPRYKDILHIYSQSTLRDINDVPVVYICAPMKMGKTKNLKAYIDKLDSGTTIIIISFRIAFSNHMLHTFDGFESYQNVQGDIKSTYNPKIIVQVDSLHRVKTKYDLLILDESESIISQFDNGSIDKKTFTIANFEYLIRSSNMIIAMDALMSERTIEVIRYMRGNNLTREILDVNIYQNGTDYTYYLTYTKTSFIDRIVNVLNDGKNIVILSNSINILNSIHSYIIELFGEDYSCILYTSQTDNDLKKEHMKNINEHCVKYQLMMYSPTITAGVSIEVAHFNEVYAIFTNTSCDTISCIQMLGRVRNVIDRNIFICFDIDVDIQAPDTVTDIEQSLINGRNELLTDLKSFNITKVDNDKYTIVYNNYYILWLYNQLIRNKSKNKFVQHIIKFIIQIGANIKLFTTPDLDDDSKYCNDKSMMDAILESYTRYKTKEAEMLLNTPDITSDEANELLCIDNKTKEQKYMLDKYFIKRDYKITDIDVDFVIAYNNKFKRNNYKNLYAILSGNNMMTTIKILQNIDVEKYKMLIENEQVEIYAKYDYVNHAHCMKILTVFGYSHLLDKSKKHITLFIERIENVDNKKILAAACKAFDFKFPTTFKITDKKDSSHMVKTIRKVLQPMNKILNYMYGYKIRKLRSDYVYMLVPYHGFDINQHNVSEQYDYDSDDSISSKKSAASSINFSNVSVKTKQSKIVPKIICNYDEMELSSYEDSTYNIFDTK